MRNAAAFRLVSHICLFLAVEVLVDPLIPENFFPFCVIIGAALLCYLAAVQLESAALRLLLALVPFAGLFLISKPIIAIVSALPLVYAAIALVSGRFFDEPWKYLRQFKPIALSAAALTLLAVLMRYYTFYSSLEEEVLEELIRQMHFTLVLMFGFFFFGFLSLRAQRPGMIRSAKWQLGIAGYFALALLAGAVLGVLLNLIAAPMLKFLTLLFYPFGYFFYLLSRLFGWAFQGLTSYEADYFGTPPPETPLPGEAAQSPAPETAVPTEDYGFSELIKLEEVNWAAITIAFFAIAALTVLIILLLKGRKNRGEFLLDTDTVRSEEMPPKRRFKREKRRAAAKSNAERVRYVYRRYLDYLRQNGVPLSVSATSEEISEKAEELLDKPDTLLRSLYLRARYEGAELTDEEVVLAEQAFERIVEKSKINKEIEEQ